MPVFLQDWWLDAASVEGEWDVCLSRDKGGNIQAVLPYHLRQRMGFSFVGKPPLTPFLGIWSPHWEHSPKNHKRYGFQDRCSREIIEQLPDAHASSIYCHPHMHNWMAFHKAGFRQTEAYTYLLEPSESVEKCFAQLKSSVRNKIRKAERHLEWEESEEVEILYDLSQQSFTRQSLPIPYSLAYLQRLDDALKRRQQRKILLVRDEQKRVHAAMYLLWDNRMTYNLVLGANTDLRSSGAVQYLLWQGIRQSFEAGRTFNFEGSMLPAVEAAFREFGAQRQPYFRLYKEKNKYWQAFKILSGR
ncbi:MAG: GNAT family N-acetyltransferase [Bacteroidota bacterium]